MRSFKPLADKDSRVLILGSMPGPVALKKGQYYGFEGNHFWRLLPEILGVAQPSNYRRRVTLLKKNRIALWDVIESCLRRGAGDSRIRQVRPNDIAALVRRFRNIRAVFLNGRTAEKLYRRYFQYQIGIPCHYLPSTSPAYAAISYRGKKKAWRVILRHL